MPSLGLCIHWNHQEPTCNDILEFVPCSFKKSCLRDRCSFIRNAMMCIDICQFRSCKSISVETSYDHNFSKDDTNYGYSDDDYEKRTYCWIVVCDCPCSAHVKFSVNVKVFIPWYAYVSVCTRGVWVRGEGKKMLK